MKIIMIDYFLPNSIYSLELCEKLSVDNEVLLICKDNYQPNGKKHNVTKILSVLHSKMCIRDRVRSCEKSNEIYANVDT